MSQEELKENPENKKEDSEVQKLTDEDLDHIGGGKPILFSEETDESNKAM